MTAIATQQLAILENVHDLLSEVGIDHWLFGGWGVDFLVGSVTRPHSDIDLVAWRSDIGQIRNLFSALGYLEQSGDDAESRADFDTNAGLLSIIYIERDARGDIVTPGIFEGFPWAEDAFDYEGSLGTIRLPVISPHEQLLTREVYFGAATGRPLREKDEQDIALLQELLGQASH